jgi:hypothetical protein
MPIGAELPATFVRRCLFGTVRRELFGGRTARLDGRFCTFDGGVLMLLDLAMTANMLCSEEAWERALEEGVSISLDASLHTRRAWTAARGQHQSWCFRARRGYADGTQHALSTCRGFTLVCVRCGSLVHWMAARCRARRAGRDAFEPGDGCSSRCCSLNHRPAQYASSQLAMAAALEAGTRLLIAWPLGRTARKVQLLPRARMLAAVHGVKLCIAARSSSEDGGAARGVRKQPARGFCCSRGADDAPLPALAADAQPPLTLTADTPSPALATATSPLLVAVVAARSRLA